ncbi:MAG: hypothetical protein ABL921_11445 [Pirellula sp.]
MLQHPPNSPAEKAWKESIAEFYATSQFDYQSVTARNLELQIAESTGKSDWYRTDFERPSIAKLIEADQQRKFVQQDVLGWITVQGLRLKLPPIFAP